MKVCKRRGNLMNHLQDQSARHGLLPASVESHERLQRPVIACHLKIKVVGDPECPLALRKVGVFQTGQCAECRFHAL
eukprot:XP_001705878.1 Hypothetical protein GL50803_37809 [Giardia lamblia ATCC 50803]